MSEKDIQARIILQATKIGSRLFRVNTGTAWSGDEITRVNTCDTYIKNSRPVKMGFVKGGSDCIGWHTVTITPEMVGKKIAVFMAVEVKKEKGRVSKEQEIFIENVKLWGGIGGVCRSVDDFENLIEKWTQEKSSK